MSHILTHNFRLRMPDEILGMSENLAQIFPDPQQFKIGIYELLLNAVEHGNLALGYETKTALLQQGRWEDEIQRRLSLPEYCDRTVDIKIIRDEHMCCLSIADQGEGFRWREHIKCLVAGKRPNGRGLWIAYNCNFERLSFNPLGNQVTCAAKYRR